MKYISNEIPEAVSQRTISQFYRNAFFIRNPRWGSTGHYVGPTAPGLGRDESRDVIATRIQSQPEETSVKLILYDIYNVTFER